MTVKKKTIVKATKENIKYNEKDYQTLKSQYIKQIVDFPEILLYNVSFIK